MQCRLFVGKGDGYAMYLAVLGTPARDLLAKRAEKGLASIVVFLDSAPEDQRQPLLDELQQMAQKKNFGCLPTMAAFASEGLDSDYDCGDQVLVMSSDYEGTLFKNVIEKAQGMGCAIVLKIETTGKVLLMDLAHSTALEMTAV